MKKIKKILIANRGEIALRIIRSAKEMGIQTVAVYSKVDRSMPFVKAADEAYCIGEAPAKDSYLVADKILATAKESQADAIHPGYGFMSENATFAEAVEKAGIIFIGPKSKAIEMMGDKLAAKKAAKAFDIPLLPGTDEPVSDLNEAIQTAKEIGFPILVKAAAGGGGKGMRVVEKEAELESQLKRAISEAKAAFGNGNVFIEKYVASPRHIEIQVLSDQHGQHFHLFERECSIQRRHQKVIEEAPSGILDEKLRKSMGESAIAAAKACDYVGAGTVEFLMDEKKNFYFLEMNTRLQVEHPVTEMITGIDLVKAQIRIAEGEKLDLQQSELKINGHAIELRVYAEDPNNDFLPDTGKLNVYELPNGPGVRVDSGMDEGDEVSVYYDPMISKLAVHAENREAAIHKMIRAIDEYRIQGIATTLSFGKFVMQHPAFQSAEFDTHFVKKHFDEKALKMTQKEENAIAATFSAYLLEQEKAQKESFFTPKQTRWQKERTEL